MGANSNYKNSSGVDLGQPLIDRSYLLDRYPELADTFKQAGLWLWGSNNNGQLGDNTTTNQSSPVQTVAGGTNWRQISVGVSYVSAIKTDGTLWSWGNNQFGALGDNTTVAKSSPVQTVAGGTNWKQVSTGWRHAAAIKTDGTLWLWGYGGFGQLGTNSINSASSPVQTVSAGTNWKQVSCAQSQTAAIKTDGTLWVWGDNQFGQLGTNDTTNRSSPVQTVSGGTNWRQVVSGGYHMAAVKTDGTLWAWGFNSSGQLGDNTQTAKSSPVQTVAGGTNWRQVSGRNVNGGTNASTFAIKTDGTLWTWGNNGYGGLGDNTTTSRSSPVQTVARGTNWRQVSGHAGVVAAIKTDGSLWVWGWNDSGALGINSNVFGRSSPVQTISAGTNWKQVACGEKNVFAIRDDSADPFGDSY